MPAESGKEFLESVRADDLDLIAFNFRRRLHRGDVSHHEAVLHRFREHLFQQRMGVPYGPGADTALAAFVALVSRLACHRSISSVVGFCSRTWPRRGLI